MTHIWRFATVILGPGVLLCLTLVGYAAADAYLFGNCDLKFGCAGGVQVVAFVAGLALIPSSVGNLSACLIFHRAVVSTQTGWVFAAVVALGLGQGALFVSSGSALPGDSLLAMMASWAGLSALFAVLVLAVIRRWSPNNSFKGMPLRGTP